MPVLLVAAGVAAGVAWSLATGQAFARSIPYLSAQGLVVFFAFMLATRGAPRWSYPWLAFGIAATQLLLYALAPRDDLDDPTIALALALSGPTIAVLLAAVIAARSWADSFVFLGLYLAGFNLGLPVALPQPASGPLVEIETARLALTAAQAILIGLAIVVWDRDALPAALGFIALTLAVSFVAAGLLAPRSGADLPEGVSFWSVLDGSVRLVILLALATFGVGAIRRAVAGMGFLSPSFAPRGPEEASSENEEASSEDEPPVAADDRPPAPTTPRRRRRSPAEETRMPQQRRRRRRGRRA
jgi:hypothetical protein